MKRDPGELLHLARLPADAAARGALDADAAADPALAAALDEGEALHALLDALHAPPPPRAEVLARIEAEVLDRMDVEAAPAAEAAEVGWGVLPLLGALVVWAGLAARAVAGGASPAAGLGSLLLAGPAFAAVAVGLAYVRPRVGLASLAAILAAAAGAAALGAWTPSAGGGGGPSPWACAGVIVVAGLVPLGALAVLYAFRGVRAGPLRFALVAAAGALAAQAVVEASCAIGGVGHALAAHAGSVALAAALGAAVGALAPGRRAAGRARRGGGARVVR